FEQGAVDYVVKPFDEDRLAITVDRLKARIGTQPPRLEDLVQRLTSQLVPRGSEHLRWIKASVGSNVRLIPVEEVLFFQSDEKYTRVVTHEAESLIRKPIRELLDELDPAKFWQVHRATIVNVDHIASVRRGLKDQAEITLRDHAETLIVSRAFTHLFKQM
ncbi:MAG TPA: response regulator transcription factor, partial [Usitatibacter sp.]|nr:response regulator transcription factor [Usitatibacter sp.]